MTSCIYVQLFSLFLKISKLFTLRCCSIGNGIGVKVIGGELLPWADNQVGAYVASILPGSVAHQLHGELHEGSLTSNLSERIAV